jgi:hypothetical protein
VRDTEQQCATLGCYWAGFFSNEPYFGIGYARQHFPWSYRIKRGYTWLKKNCDLKELISLVHDVRMRPQRPSILIEEKNLA